MINFCHINARAEGNLKDGDKEHLFVESLLGLEISTRNIYSRVANKKNQVCLLQIYLSFSSFFNRLVITSTKAQKMQQKTRLRHQISINKLN